MLFFEDEVQVEG